jgi:hypothetical protein
MGESSDSAQDVRVIVRLHAGLLPFVIRIGLWRTMFGRDWRSFPRFILPDCIQTELKRLLTMTRRYAFWRAS